MKGHRGNNTCRVPMPKPPPAPPLPEKKTKCESPEMERLAKEIDDIGWKAAHERDEERKHKAAYPKGSCFVSEEGNGGGWPIYSKVVFLDVTDSRMKAVQFYFNCGNSRTRDDRGEVVSIFTREGPVGNNPYVKGSSHPVRELEKSEFDHGLKQFEESVDRYVSMAKKGET